MDKSMDISMDLSMDIHIHRNPEIVWHHASVTLRSPEIRWLAMKNLSGYNFVNFLRKCIAKIIYYSVDICLIF